MGISFACSSCRKRYTVADSFGGKKVKCKQCGQAMSIPMPPPAGLDEPDVDALMDLAPPPGSTPVHVSAPAPRAARQATAAVGSVSGDGGRLPPWAVDTLTFLNRIRPRKLWVWIAVAIPLLLGLSFLNDTLALGVIILFAAVGGLVMLAAAVWGVGVGLTQGSKAVWAAIVAAPLAVIGGVAKTLNRKSGTLGSGGDLAIGWIIAASVMGLATIVLVIGFISNPRAFKGPIKIGAVGLLLVLLSIVPAVIQSQQERRYAGPTYVPSAPRYTSPRPPSGGGTITRPTPRPPEVQLEPGVTLPPIIRLNHLILAKAGDTWMTATIRKIDRRGWVQVQYREAGWEWVEPWRIRLIENRTYDIPKAEVNAEFTGETTPAPDRPLPPSPQVANAQPVTPQPGGAVPAAGGSVGVPAYATVGATVSAKWGGSWWDAKVLKIERGWVQVHFSDNTYEWIQPWRIRPLGSKEDNLPSATPNSGVGRPDSPAPAGSPPPMPAR